MLLKEPFKHSCVCSLVSVTFPFRRPARHQLCHSARGHLKPGQYMYCRLFCNSPVQMLPPQSTSELYKKQRDIYIDLVKLTLWWWKPQFSFSGWYFSVELQHCIYVHFAFKMFCVVLQHLRNSQEPLIFLQTVVCKLTTKLTVPE